MGRRRLLHPDKLADLLRRRALREDPQLVARRFGLSVNQVHDLVSYHKQRFRIICAHLDVTMPKRGGSKPGPRGPRESRASPPAHNTPAIKTRPCLKCRRTFESTTGNRICKICKDTAAWKAGRLVHTVTLPRMG